MTAQVEWVDDQFNTGTLAWGSQPSRSAFGAQTLMTLNLGSGSLWSYAYADHPGSNQGFFGMCAPAATGKHGLCISIHSISNPINPGDTYGYITKKSGSYYVAPVVYWTDGIIQ